MSVTLNGTSGIVFNDSTTQGTSAFYGGLAFRNRIINGAMVINQRGFSGNITTAAEYTLDRWRGEGSVSNKFTVAQSSTAPTGFINSALITSTAATSLGAGDYYMFYQSVEGLNCADFGFGTASASTVTLSFWVYSSLTGTFGGALNNSDATRSYPFTYAISAANTWEQKSITIAGDTSGTWLKTNGRGIMVRLGLGVGTTYSGTANAWAGATYFSATGATSVVGTNGATFYITGVQLEKGSTATSFDYRPYGTELALCQRYYYRIISPVANNNDFGVGFNNNTTLATLITPFPVPMRSSPTALEQSGTASDYQIIYLATSATCSAVPIFAIANLNLARSTFTVASGLTAGQGSGGRAAANTTAYLGWSAEL
jgi:hypothetical protein